MTRTNQEVYRPFFPLQFSLGRLQESNQNNNTRPTCTVFQRFCFQDTLFLTLWRIWCIHLDLICIDSFYQRDSSGLRLFQTSGFVTCVINREQIPHQNKLDIPVQSFERKKLVEVKVLKLICRPTSKHYEQEKNIPWRAHAHLLNKLSTEVPDHVGLLRKYKCLRDHHGWQTQSWDFL